MRGTSRVVLVPALVLAAMVAASAAWAVEAGASLRFSTREKFEPNGYVRILVLRDGRWREAARIAADEHLRSRTVDLASWLSDTSLAVRLEPTGGGSAHLDAVLVDGAPSQGLDDRLARKLSAADNDLVDFAEVAGKDFTFTVGRDARLQLTARIEPEVLGTEPVAYPGVDTYRPVSAFTSFYTYQPGSNPLKPVLDGSINAERLGDPFFRETLPSGTGHPDSPTWAWVGDDGRTLFALLDVTADNTSDPGKDYARLHVRTASGVRTYEVSSRERRWGASGFEYTDRVGWEHKVYEIAVPLSELGTIGDLELAFTVYGTLGPATLGWDADVNGVDPDSGAPGTTFTFTVVFQDSSYNAAPTRHDLWIDIDDDFVQDAGTPALLPLGGAGPWIAGLALAAAAGLLIVSRRRALPRLAAIAIAAFALSTCKLPPTTQEIYPMSPSGSSWSTGVVYSVEVPLVAEPESYDFEFLFVNAGDYPVINGAAVGAHAVVVE